MPSRAPWAPPACKGWDLGLMRGARRAATMHGSTEARAMPTNVRVIHPSDFLRARADGRVDLDMGKSMLEQLAEAAAPLQRFEMLIDLRDAVGMLTPEDLHELAGSLIHFRKTFLHRTALLCPR